jgi:hypothetical protein
MRVGFGKRIGGFYFGAAQFKQIGNGIIAILLFPFYSSITFVFGLFVASTCVMVPVKEEKLMRDDGKSLVKSRRKCEAGQNETKVPVFSLIVFDLLTEKLSKWPTIERSLPPQKESRCAPCTDRGSKVLQ